MGEKREIPKKKRTKEPGLVVSQADRILHLQVGVGVGWKISIIVINTSGPPGAVDREFDSKFAYIVLLVLLLVLCCGLLHACVDRP